MDTLTGRTALPIMITWFDNAGLPLTQDDWELSRQVIVSRFAGEYVSVELFAAAILTPFTFH
jgi:hypothetical protein